MTAQPQDKNKMTPESYLAMEKAPLILNKPARHPICCSAEEPVDLQRRTASSDLQAGFDLLQKLEIW